MTATLQDLNVEARTRSLVCWANRWDEVLSVLTGGGHGHLPDDQAEASLVQSISHFAHPLLDAATLRDLALALRDACNARTNYELYGYLPEHLDGRFPDGAHAEDIDTALDNDVDLALWPLLTGLSTVHACTECIRLRQDVTTWAATEQGSSRCGLHRLVLASI